MSTQRYTVPALLGSGALCILWAMFLAFQYPDSESDLPFLFAGLMLFLAPVYSRVRFEKDEKGFRFFLITPSLKEVVEAERIRSEIERQRVELDNRRREEKSAKDQREIAKLEKALAEKEELLRKKQQEISESESHGCLTIIGGVTVLVVILGLIAGMCQNVARETESEGSKEKSVIEDGSP